MRTAKMLLALNVLCFIAGMILGNMTLFIISQVYVVGALIIIEAKKDA